MICVKESVSPKKKKANTIVDIGPKLPIIATLEAPSLAIAEETKYEGIIVENSAIKILST